MKTLFRGLALFLALSLPVAAAQSDLISAYRSIQAALETARTSLRTDPAGALAKVQASENTFRRVSGQLSATLSSGATSALKNAQLAVSRSSATDFGAQSGQIKAILERGMFETYFRIFTNTAQAGRYAVALGQALKLSPAARADLSNSTRNGNQARARAILESAIAQIISNALQSARDNAGNRAVAFASISRAANHFLIVQDSPRVGEISVASFSSAIAALTSNDTAGFQQAVGSLSSQIRGFAQASRAISVSTPTTKPVVSSTKASTTPAVAPTADSTVSAIRAALTKAGIAGGKAEQLARDLANQGYGSLDAALDRVSVKLSSALSKIQDANIPDGRAAISDAKNTFDSSLRAVVEAADPALATRVSRVFEATEAAAGVRPVDVTVLLGEIDTIRNWSEGKPMSALQGVVATVQPLWMGYLRGGLFLTVALLFSYPIYLLGLAFGGRNPYWRYIGIAMVLLFIPPLIEGLAWLGSFIAQGTGLRFLDGLTSLSVLQNPLAQIAWVVILFLTVGFATAGFRGIAAQFGLIRTRNPGAVTGPASMGTAAFASANNTPLERGVSNNTQQVPSTVERTIVEWDEEF